MLLRVIHLSVCISSSSLSLVGTIRLYACTHKLVGGWMREAPLGWWGGILSGSQRTFDIWVVGHLGCFWFWDRVNKTALNIPVKVFYVDLCFHFSWVKYLAANGMAQLYGIFNFQGCCPSEAHHEGTHTSCIFPQHQLYSILKTRLTSLKSRFRVPNSRTFHHIMNLASYIAHRAEHKTHRATNKITEGCGKWMNRTRSESVGPQLR